MLWDLTPLITDEAVAQIKMLGGLRAIAISHPHYYATMTEWSAAFGGVPIHLHADDAEHVMRPDRNIVHWTGETLELGQGLTLIRCGGHFAGSAVLHWAAGAGGKAGDRLHRQAGQERGNLHADLPPRSAATALLASRR